MLALRNIEVILLQMFEWTVSMSQCLNHLIMKEYLTVSVCKYLVQYVPLKKHLILLQNIRLAPEFLLVRNALKEKEKELERLRERRKKDREEAAKTKAEQVAKKKEETIGRKEEAAKEAAKKRAKKLEHKRRASVARTSAANRSNNVDPDDGILQSEIVSADFD